MWKNIYSLDWLLIQQDKALPCWAPVRCRLGFFCLNPLYLLPMMHSVQPQDSLSFSSKVIHPSIILSQLRSCAKLIILNPVPSPQDTTVSCEALLLTTLVVRLPFQPACGRDETRVNWRRQEGGSKRRGPEG